jgi:hypothetical protein
MSNFCSPVGFLWSNCSARGVLRYPKIRELVASLIGQNARRREAPEALEAIFLTTARFSSYAASSLLP